MFFKSLRQLICKHDFTAYQKRHFYIAECLKCGIQFPYSQHKK